MRRPLSEEAWVTRSSLGWTTVGKESVKNMAEMYSLASNLSIRDDAEEQKKREKKFCEGLCKIWKLVPDRKLKGNGVLLRSADELEALGIYNAKYFIWTSRATLDGDDDISKYEIQFCCRSSGWCEGIGFPAKKPLSLKEIMLFKHSLRNSILFVLSSEKLKLISNNINERASNVLLKQVGTTGNIFIHWVGDLASSKSEKDPFKHCSQGFTIIKKTVTGDLMISNDASHLNIPPGSRVVNSENNVLGVYGGGSTVSTLWRAAGRGK